MAILVHDSTLLESLEANGFHVLREAVPLVAVEAILEGLQAALSRDEGGSTLRTSDGNTYGARNVLRLWPDAANVWKHPPLPTLLSAVLGPRFGLVRGLYFDKPPGESWALPWHRDLTIAVRDNRLPCRRFTKPTRKAGVPHVEAPREVLERMLTLRIHLDEVTDENGPLHVIPQSHRVGDLDRPPLVVRAGRGDVLLMRPLLSHSSPRSFPDSRRHRRILHLEFAADPELGDGFAWHTFLPGLNPPQP